MDWDDFKDVLWLFLFGVGVTMVGIIALPFIGLYYLCRGVWWCMPWSILKRKAESQASRMLDESIRKRNAEISLQEERLGLSKRNDSCVYYDPYYYKNQKNATRRDYLENLMRKVADQYASPDVMVAVERYAPLYYEKFYKEADRYPQRWNGSDWCSPEFGDLDDTRPINTRWADKCYVLLLVRNTCFHLPDNALIRHKDAARDKYKDMLALSVHADRYFRDFERYMKWFAFHPSQMTEPHESYFRRLYTLTECGHYEDYRIVQVPGEYRFEDVEAGTDERLNEFIEDFKRRYKKVEQ